MKRTTYILLALLLACHARAQFGALPVVQVQRWTPLNLGTKLAIWYDGNDASTLLDAGGNVATNGAYVQTWQDKSGNGRHATAPAEAQRPRWFSGIQNERAVMRTDGDDQLNIGSAGGVFRNKAAGYIFLVAKDANQTGGDPYHAVALFSTAAAGTTRLGTWSRFENTTQWNALARLADAEASATIASGGAAAGHTLSCAFGDWGNGYVRVSVNGQAFSSTALPGSGATSDTDGGSAMLFRTHAGTECPADSELAEVVIVNAAMTDAEITALQNYLKTKWGTP